MKRGVLILVLTCLPVLAAFAQSRLHWGVEWGMGGTVYTHHDYQYTTLEGHHIDHHYYDNADQGNDRGKVFGLEH